MGTRESLHTLLKEILGSGNVYFQPPESTKIRYPCIVYDMNGQTAPRADDKVWRRFPTYSLLYITRDVYDFTTDASEDAVVDRLSNLPYCSMGTPYTAENLYHYPFTIQY